MRPNLYSQITSELRNAISSGAMPPGSQVPTRVALAKTYATTVVTVQKALAQLEQSGLVVSRGWRGTFVSDAPSCLCRYALLLRTRSIGPEGAPHSIYHHALVQAACELTTDRQSFTVYEGLGDPAAAELTTLLHDVARFTIAGLICVDVDPSAFPPLRTAMQAQRIIAVNVGPHVPSFSPWELAFDRAGLYRQSLSILKDRGCRRPAVAFASLGTTVNSFESMARHVAGLGMDLAPGHALGFDPYQPLWPDHWIRLLMSLPANRRPDGIYITDDHLTTAVCAGLTACGITPGIDLPVVAHANLPTANRPTGVHLSGYDNTEILLAAARLITEARTSAAPGRQVLLPAQVVLADEGGRRKRRSGS